MNKETARPLLVAAILSVIIWVISPTLTGRPEPWDGEGLYYIVALLLAGVISGIAVPDHLKHHYVGAILGQTIYGLLFFSGGLFPLGLIFLAIYSLLFLAGAFLGSKGRLRFEKKTP